MGCPPGGTERQDCRTRPPFPRSLETASSPETCKGTDGVGTRTTCTLSSSISTGPQCPTIPTYSFTVRSPIRACERSPTSGGGSRPPVICHCLLSRFFRRISSQILEGRRGRWSARVRCLGADAAVVSWMAQVTCPLHSCRLRQGEMTAEQSDAPAGRCPWQPGPLINHKCLLT
jgi:hypothetical protein